MATTLLPCTRPSHNCVCSSPARSLPRQSYQGSRALWLHTEGSIPVGVRGGEFEDQASSLFGPFR